MKKSCTGRAGRRAAVLIIPAAAFYLLSFVIPMIRVIYLSFYSTNFVTTKFIGIENYIRIFSDIDFIKSFFTALVYTVMIVPPVVYLSYKISLAVSSLVRREMAIYQMIYYLPTLTCGIIISFIWRWVFGRLGLLAIGFDSVGLTPIAWLAGGWTARVAVSVAIIFSAIGGNCIWLCAVMLSIPKELYEQAQIDGASRRQATRYITRPLVANTLALLAFLTAMGTLQYWEVIYSLTSGGPFKMTATPVYDIYITAFNYSRFGLAAAKALVLIIVLAALVGIRRILERKAT